MLFRSLPAVCGRLHARFNTPHAAVVAFAVLAWVLAATGTFEWSLMVSAGAGMVYYLVICAAVLRLRSLEPAPAPFRLPFGAVFSVAGTAICLVLLSRLGFREALLMTITAVIAGANWWWARGRPAPPVLSAPVPEPVIAPTNYDLTPADKAQR